MAIGQYWSLGWVTQRWDPPLLITIDSMSVFAGRASSTRKCWSLVPSDLEESPLPPTISAFSSTHLNDRIDAPPAEVPGPGDPPMPVSSAPGGGSAGVEPIPWRSG